MRVGIDLGWLSCRLIAGYGPTDFRPIPHSNDLRTFHTLPVVAYWEVDGEPVRGALVGQAALDIAYDQQLNLRTCHALASAINREETPLAILLTKFRRDIFNFGLGDIEVTFAADQGIDDYILAKASAAAGFKKAFRVARAAASNEYQHRMKAELVTSPSEVLVVDVGFQKIVLASPYEERQMARSFDFVGKSEDRKASSQPNVLCKTMFGHWAELFSTLTTQDPDIHDLQESWNLYRNGTSPIISSSGPKGWAMSRAQIRSSIVDHLRGQLATYSASMSPDLDSARGVRNSRQILLLGPYASEALEILSDFRVQICPDVSIAAGALLSVSRSLSLENELSGLRDRLESLPINDGSHEVVEQPDQSVDSVAAQEQSSRWEEFVSKDEVILLRDQEADQSAETLGRLLNLRSTVVSNLANAPTSQLEEFYNTQKKVLDDVGEHELSAFARAIGIPEAQIDRFVAKAIQARTKGHKSSDQELDGGVPSFMLSSIRIIEPNKSVESDSLGICLDDRVQLHGEAFDKLSKESRLLVSKTNEDIVVEGRALPTYTVVFKKGLGPSIYRLLALLGPRPAVQAATIALYLVVFVAASSALWVLLSPSPDAKQYAFVTAAEPLPSAQILCGRTSDTYCNAGVSFATNLHSLSKKAGDCHSFYALILSDPIFSSEPNVINLISPADKRSDALLRARCILYKNSREGFPTAVVSHSFADDGAPWKILGDEVLKKESLSGRESRDGNRLSKVIDEYVGKYGPLDGSMTWKIELDFDRKNYEKLPPCIDLAFVFVLFSKQDTLTDKDIDLIANDPDIFSKLQFVRFFKGASETSPQSVKPFSQDRILKSSFTGLITPEGKEIYLSGECPALK
jgi:hypothetical protein